VNAILIAALAAVVAVDAQTYARLDDAVAAESDAGSAPQVSTAKLREILAAGNAILLDARPVEEFAMSHIPGALNVAPKPGIPMSLYVSDVAEVRRLVPQKERLLVLYCNGPFCGKSRRLADELAAAGYQNLRR
jgi:rhodanese-related sulfurtransferase